MSRIMIIAGGDWQCPIVQTAKKMGHEVICSNLYENSPAFQYADWGEVANVLDKEKNLEIAKKYHPDAVLTDQSDIAVPTVAYVAAHMGLKGIGEDIAQLFTNKSLMRDFCKSNGFPYPKYKLCYSCEEAVDFFEKVIGGKAIIKPVDSQSSRGIHIIEDSEQLRNLYEDALQYSHSVNAVLVEQYIEGIEFTVDGLKTSNGYFVTAISRKKHYSYNASIAQELLFSHYDGEYDYDELRTINTQMVCKMGLPYGMTHAEYKFMNGQFYLIEIAARGGGTKISSDIVPIMSGINSNEIFINQLLGKEKQVKLSDEREKCALLGLFDLEPGKVAGVEGLNEARNYMGVKDIMLPLQAGDIIERAKDDRSRAGHYILWADNYGKLRELEEKVKSTIHIIYEGK